jgi:hypothetical protein
MLYTGAVSPVYLKMSLSPYSLCRDVLKESQENNRFAPSDNPNNERNSDSLVQEHSVPFSRAH